MSEQEYTYTENQVIAEAGWVTFQTGPQRSHLTIKGAPGSDAVYEGLWQFREQLGLSEEQYGVFEDVGTRVLDELITLFTTGGMIDKQARTLIFGEAFTRIRPIFNQEQLHSKGIMSTRLMEMRKRAEEEGIQLNELFPAEGFGDTTGLIVVDASINKRVVIYPNAKFNYEMMQLLDDNGQLVGGSDLIELCEIFGKRLRQYLANDERTANHVSVVSRPGLIRQMIVDIVEHGFTHIYPEE